jgi:transposase
MDYYAGIDVSLELSSVCIVDKDGRIVREVKVTSEPEALVALLRGVDLALARIGLEAGPLSQWLHAGLTEAGYDAVLLETRHVKAALSAMTVKTDRKDARGIAQLLRMGWFRPVHCKASPAQEVRALLAGRKLLQNKMRDIELGIRGLAPGAVASEVARRHGIHPNQLYGWRREVRTTTAPTEFVAVTVAAEPITTESPVGRPGEVSGIELRIGNAEMRIGRDVDPRVIMAAIRALKAAP